MAMDADEKPDGDEADLQLRAAFKELLAEPVATEDIANHAQRFLNIVKSDGPVVYRPESESSEPS